MGILKVKFHKGAGTTFHDISSLDILLSSSFMEELTAATREKVNYEAAVVGIDEVSTPSGLVEGGNFLVVGLEEADGGVDFLFQILPSETSRLVGVNPRIENSRRLKTILNKVAENKVAGGVRLMI